MREIIDMDNNFATGSNLYKEFLAEKEEILKHKWIESEKAGRDIGWERALLSWCTGHKAEWKRHRHNLK